MSGSLKKSNSIAVPLTHSASGNEAMNEEARTTIKEIMAGMQCPKNFKCAESSFENLCKARDVGMNGYLDCIEANRAGCSYVFSFGHGYLCRCPLRNYLARKLKK